jgi:molybdopterin synthase catalytic subunit
MKEPFIHITAQALDPQEITWKVRQPSKGAVITFLGTARNETKGRPVLFLEYEAYESMLIKTISAISYDLQKTWGPLDMAFAHRTGRVNVGEISMIVAIATPHRKEGFTASWAAVDRIKEVAPIWKKEVYEDGSSWVGCNNEQLEANFGLANPAKRPA